MMSFSVYRRRMHIITWCSRTSFISMIGLFIRVLYTFVWRRLMFRVAKASRNFHTPGVNKTERSWTTRSVLSCWSRPPCCCCGLKSAGFLWWVSSERLRLTERIRQPFLIDISDAWCNRTRHQQMIVQLSVRVRAADV